MGKRVGMLTYGMLCLLEWEVDFVIAVSLMHGRCVFCHDVDVIFALLA